MPSRRRAAIAVAAVATGAILGATLIPTGTPVTYEAVPCVFCGGRASADALLNLALFAPLGLGLVLLRVRFRRALLIGAGLSAVIELAQVALPGRDPSLGDILANALGCGAGWLLPTLLGRLSVAAPVAAGAWCMAFAGAAVGIVAATGALLQPSPTDARFYGQWTPELGHLEVYDGEVVAATIDDAALPGGPLDDSGPIRELLSGRGTLRVTAVAGTPPPGLAPLVSVYDEAEREIFLVGPDRTDLVGRFRTRAAALRLDTPAFRWRGALGAMRAGDTLRLAARFGPTTCLRLNAREACAPRAAAGSAWSFLLYPARISAIGYAVLCAIWLAVLALPIGFTARWLPAAIGAAGILAAGLVAVAPAVGLARAAPGEVAGVAAGLLLGWGARRLMSERDQALGHL